jgi:nitroreductase
MDVMTAIRNRRSMGRVSPQPVERAIIEELLEAANWAPSHHGTEPWRFWVFTGAGRDKLAEVFAAVAEKERAKPYRAPVVIAVACVPQPGADTVGEEEAATAAAVQNLLLAMEARGLAGIWRTGSLCREPKVREFFGLREQDTLQGFIYLGYPDPAAPPKEGRRGPVAAKTVWYEG